MLRVEKATNHYQKEGKAGEGCVFGDPVVKEGRKAGRRGTEPSLPRHVPDEPDQREGAWTHPAGYEAEEEDKEEEEV